MSTFIHLMPQTLEADAGVITVEAQPQENSPAKVSGWDVDSFAEEQIRGLVRNLYLTGSKPSRQVVFTAVGRESNVSGLCHCIGQTLSAQVCGSICLLDLQDASAAPEKERVSISSDHARFGRLRDCSLQLSSQLWYMPGEVFTGVQSNGFSTAWLRSRLAELRLEFDYLVIQAPAAGATNQAALIARLCDGLVLIVEANSTRRASAQRVKEVLDAAHVRLLGIVLSERTFPIPQVIYKRV
jgi:hypothetical protein